jgi:hypothetical protein
MYWWNYNLLALALRENRVKPWHRFAYWATFISFILLTIIAYYYGDKPTSLIGIVYDYILTAASFTLMFLVPYRINKSGDGKDFFNRLVCLTFPLSIRYFVIFGPIIIIAMISGLRQACLSAGHPPELIEQCINNHLAEGVFAPTAIDLAIYIISIIVWFYWLRKAFIAVSNPKVSA